MEIKNTISDEQNRQLKSSFAFYALDIETRGDKDLVPVFMGNINPPKNYKDEEKINAYMEEKKKQARKGMAVDTDYARIVCIGVKELGEKGKCFTLVEFAQFLKELKDESRQATFITFNGKKFDLPVIIKNGLKYKIGLPYKQLIECTKRYNQKVDYIQHIDLFESIGIAGDWKSLDLYSQIYLGKKKENNNEHFFDYATDEDLKARCLEDLQITEELYLKFVPVL